ncbi:MAG: DUF362 domain-containing protein [Archaeoglobaceae archaeon]|nr:DUF362 domain-containing protein [Archaeoglobaceae archaeon]MDW8117981.1 DUF362 domain-containing protein [Archaeoglobaceae archaeon]
MPKVLVGNVESYEKVEKFIEKVYETFGFKKCSYLKPNLLKFKDPANGCITHPEVIKAILKCAKEHGDELTVIEGGFYKYTAKKCFEAFGLNELAKCINLNEEEFLEVEINGKALKSVKMAKTAVEARNKFISVPKLKVHHKTIVTIGIENNMGFLKKPAIYMHPRISQKLVDLLHFTSPPLTIVDGIIGGNGSESSTVPLKHGVMVASDDVVACDFVCAKLMGFNPRSIKHIRLAMKTFGISEDKIEIEGDLIVKKYSLSLFNRIFGRFI